MIGFLLLAVSFAPMQREAASYWVRITGREIPRDALTFAIDASVSHDGNDAYSIVSTNGGARVTGSNVRSVWYGLYDLLERRGGCRWFWDGDVVPKRESIDLSGLVVREEAGFQYRAIRYFAHRGLTRFQAEHWGLEDWRKEIDWCLKRRLNVFMLRIGQDDLFQRAFPETVSYPDPSKPLPGAGQGYDNRSLFWSLEYRGKLREKVQRYGRDRGMMIPEDFGTMTHWYSRTPEEFLQKRKPAFLPQATRTYAEKNGLVWDVRDSQWVDAYWNLTRTAVREYGAGRPELLHTIGLGERRCFTNRAENLNLKIKALDAFVSRARCDYPDAKVLLAGWDFYFTWRPDEVKSLISRLDPQRVIIWDYEGDATTDGCADMKGVGNNFTKWGVVGKFPYTYSMFLAYESALDIRANYSLIAERFAVVKDDPMCKGFIFWPEASHTDTLALRYFTENAWRRGRVPVAEVLSGFCGSRYGRDANLMRVAWEKTIPISSILGWGGNCGRTVIYGPEDEKACLEYKSPKSLDHAVEALEPLLHVDWKNEFVRRDAVDLARTVADRAITDLCCRMMRAYAEWRRGMGDADSVCALAKAYAHSGRVLADLLELHTDYSLYESFQRLEAIEKICNPAFGAVLLDNAACDYCHSHHFELARHWYEPVMAETAERICSRVRSGDRAPLTGMKRLALDRRAQVLRRSLTELRPRATRIGHAFRKAVRELAQIIGGQGFK